MGSFLSSIFSSAKTKREREKISSQCATRTSALKACVSAYPKNKEACEKLSEDLALCKARLVDKCTAKAEKFEEMCVKLMVVREQSNEEKRKCAKAAKNMQKCVNRFWTRGYRLDDSSTSNKLVVWFEIIELLGRIVSRHLCHLRLDCYI